MGVEALPVPRIAELSRRVLAEVSTVVVGMEPPLRTALATILAGGHVLFEDVPGLGKTLAARSLAGALGLEFRRLQCTPDLLPADITGSYVYDPRQAEFAFRPGPIFTGLLLAEEINRTAPKTQSALLEAMAEGQVTVEGTSFRLEGPFHVLATSNPVEYEGTYPLPEAQLDRFMVRLAVEYPSRAGEATVLSRRVARRQEATSVRAVVDPRSLLGMPADVEMIDVDVLDYCVALTAATRTHPGVEVGASPRGSLALLLVSRALAAVGGRDFVTPRGRQSRRGQCLAHRLTLTPRTGPPAWPPPTSSVPCSDRCPDCRPPGRSGEPGGADLASDHGRDRLAGRRQRAAGRTGGEPARGGGAGRTPVAGCGVELSARADHRRGGPTSAPVSRWRRTVSWSVRSTSHRRRGRNCWSSGSARPGTDRWKPWSGPADARSASRCGPYAPAAERSSSSTIAAPAVTGC